MAERNEPSRAEVERMNYIQGELEKFIRRFRENTEVAIIVGAMMRVSRHLLDFYPEGLRLELVKASAAFLERRDLETADRIFQIPKGLM